jgi:hypothetical protein
VKQTSVQSKPVPGTPNQRHKSPTPTAGAGERGKRSAFSSRVCRSISERGQSGTLVNSGLSRGVPLTAFGDFCPHKSNPLRLRASLRSVGSVSARLRAGENAAETALVSDFPLTLWLTNRVSVVSVDQIVTSAPKEPSNHTASADLRPSVTRLVNSCR